MVRPVVALLLVTVSLIAACTPQAGTLATGHTNLVGSFTEQVPISNHPNHVLVGHLIDATRDGTRVRALIIHQRRDGVHRLLMWEAWSYGIELPFSNTILSSDGCYQRQCGDWPVGMIFLPEAAMEIGAEQGVQARLLGRDGAIDIQVPASLFQSLPQNPAHAAP